MTIHTTVTTAAVPAPPAPTLRRELGKWDLTAIGINQVIGSAIFLLPAAVATQVGNWSPIAFLLAGLASLLVALCFAEVGSRFERTAVPTSMFARLLVALSDSKWVDAVVTRSRAGWHRERHDPRAGCTGGDDKRDGSRCHDFGGHAGAWLDQRPRIRPSALAINLFTVAKLAPLAIFILAGLWFTDFSRSHRSARFLQGKASSAALLLIFALAATM